MTKRRNETNEPELDTWAPLAAANTRMLNKIFQTPFGEAAPTASQSGAPEQKKEDAADQRGSSDAEKRRDAEHRAYVNQRLKDFAAFERRASGSGRRK